MAEDISNGVQRIRPVERTHRDGYAEVIDELIDGLRPLQGFDNMAGSAYTVVKVVLLSLL